MTNHENPRGHERHRLDRQIEETVRCYVAQPVVG